MLNVSIVLYRHTVQDIQPLFFTLAASMRVNRIYLIDNSPEETEAFKILPAKYIFNGKNLGYGTAHNIALRKTIEDNIPYHLVVNPDIRFDKDALLTLEQYMEKYPNVGLVAPRVFYPNGNIQFLCKLLPTPFDLMIRRFLPSFLFRKSRNRFELRQSGYDTIMEVPYLSGSFMFLRMNALRDVGLFDERFFMYPEDIDLSRRIHAKFKTVFNPTVNVIHYHEQGSYKNSKLLFIHLWNLVKYFNKWGWLFDKERKKVNEETLRKLNLKNS